MAEETDIQDPVTEDPADKHKELDSIVSKMTTAKESPENIQKVKDYYTQNYFSKEPAPAQPPSGIPQSELMKPVETNVPQPREKSPVDVVKEQAGLVQNKDKGTIAHQKFLNDTFETAKKDVESDSWKEKVFKGEKPLLTQTGDAPISAYQTMDPKAVDEYISSKPDLTNNQKSWLKGRLLAYGHQRQTAYTVTRNAATLKRDNPEMTDEAALQKAAVDHEHMLQDNIAAKLNNTGFDDKPLNPNAPFHDQITGMNKTLMGALNYAGDVGSTVGSLLDLGGVPGFKDAGYALKIAGENLKGRNVIPQNGEAGNYLAGGAVPTFLNMLALGKIAGGIGEPIYGVLDKVGRLGKFGEAAKMGLGGLAISPFNSYVISKQYMDDQIKQGVDPSVAGHKADQLFAKNLATDALMTPLQMGLLKLPTGGLVSKVLGFGAEGAASGMQFLTQGYNMESIDNPALHVLDYAKNNKNTFIEGAVLGMLQKGVTHAIANRQIDDKTNQLFKFDKSGTEGLPSDGAIAHTVLSALEMKPTVKRVDELHGLVDAMKTSGTYSDAEAAKIKQVIDDVAAVKPKVPKYGTSEQKIAVFNELLNVRSAERFLDPNTHESATSGPRKAIKASESRIEKIMDGTEPLYFVNGVETGRKQIEDMMKEHPELLSKKGMNFRIVGDPELQEMIKTVLPTNVTQVRHGETHQDSMNRASSQSDISLNAEGRQQVKDLGEELKGKEINTVVSSDVKRAMETAEGVAKDVEAKHEIEPRFRAWDIGEFENKPDHEWDEAKAFFANNPDATEYKGQKIGESFNDWKNRIVEAKTDLDQNANPGTLLVNHSNNIMLLDAIEHNGGWNEEAKKEYLAAKAPEPAMITPEANDKIGREKFNGTLVEGRGTHFQDFFDKVSGELTGVTDSKDGFRVDIPGMSQVAREDAISDIMEGKVTDRATKMLSELERQYEQGKLEYTKGSGNHTEKKSVPVEDLHEPNKLTPGEERLITEEPTKIDEVLSSGVSTENIDDPLVKKVFNGFPFTEEDYNLVKSYLDEKGNIAENKEGGVGREEAPRDGKSSEAGDTEAAEGKIGSGDRKAADDKGRAGQGDIGSEAEFRAELEKLFAKPKKGEPALAKVGEKAEEGVKTTTPGAYTDPMKALNTIREEHPDNPLFNRTADFLEKVLKGKKITIENVSDLKEPTAGLSALGLSKPGGHIQIDFAAHPNMEEAHRTILHELLHEASRYEIAKDGDFQKEIRQNLTEIRKALDIKYRLPGADKDLPLSGNLGDLMIPSLIAGKKIPMSMYGLTNEHEVISELFTNPDFVDLLKKLPAPESTPAKPKNMLTRIFESIAKVFNRNYGAVRDLKQKISATDMADYLTQLTEGYLKDKKALTSETGESLPSLRKTPEEKMEDKIKQLVARTKGNVSDEMLAKHIKDIAGYDDAKIDDLIYRGKEEYKDKTAQQLVDEAVRQGEDMKELAKRVPNANDPGIIKTMKRWYLDRMDDVSLAKSILRQTKGREEQQIAQQFEATKKLVSELNKMPTRKQQALILALERPELLKDYPPAIKDLADMWRTRLDAAFDRAQKAFPNLNFIEDYFPHFWKKPDEMKNFMAASISKAPLEGNKSFTKQRFFETILGGLKKGYDLSTSNPEELVRLAEMNTYKFEAAHDIFTRMKAAGLLKFSTAKDVDPTWKTVDDPMFNKIGAYVDGETGNANVSTGRYMMPPDVAKLMNDYLSVGLKAKAFDFVRGFNNIKNAVQLGVGFYHYGTTTIEALNNTTTQAIQKISTLKPGNVASGLLDLGKVVTGIGVVEQKLRGAKATKDYLLGNMTDDVQALMDANARVSKQKLYSLDARYKASKAWNRLAADSDFKQLPKAVANSLMVLPEVLNNFLMNKWVPQLKVGGYLKGLDSEIASRPNMTPQELQRAKERIWDSMDNRLGQVVYDNLFMNKSAKDLAFMTLRSFGWTGGTVIAAGKGVGEIGMSAKQFVKGEGVTQRTAYLLALPATVGMLGAMFQYMMTGQGPQEWKDYFYPKDGTKNSDGSDHRVVLPTYLKDVGSYSQHPGQTVVNKMSPFLNDFASIYQNKDFYGEQIYNPKDPLYQKGIDALEHVVGSSAPFALKQTPGEEPTLGQKARQTIGITPAAKAEQRTDLQNKIMEAYTEKIDNGKAATHEEMVQRGARRDLRTFLYQGGEWDDADEELKTKANITPERQEQFIKDARIDPYERYFKGLLNKDKIGIYEQMDPADQEKYKPYLPKDYKPE